MKKIISLALLFFAARAVYSKFKANSASGMAPSMGAGGDMNTESLSSSDERIWTDGGGGVKNGLVRNERVNVSGDSLDNASLRGEGSGVGGIMTRGEDDPRGGIL